jgi:hypothetical protein
MDNEGCGSILCFWQYRWNNTMLSRWIVWRSEHRVQWGILINCWKRDENDLDHWVHYSRKCVYVWLSICNNLLCFGLRFCVLLFVTHFLQPPEAKCVFLNDHSPWLPSIKLLYVFHGRCLRDSFDVIIRVYSPILLTHPIFNNLHINLIFFICPFSWLHVAFGLSSHLHFLIGRFV